MMVPGWWAGAEAGVVDAVSAGIPAWVSEIGAPGLLALTVILILTGKLVPAGQMRELRADRDLHREASSVKDQTIRDLTEANKTAQDVLRALGRASEKDAAP